MKNVKLKRYFICHSELVSVRLVMEKEVITSRNAQNAKVKAELQS